MNKINLLFDASVLEYNIGKEHHRSGIFFVAYNILREFAKREEFAVSLCVYNKSIIKKIKADPFLASFPVISSLRDEEILLFNIDVHRKQIKETRNPLLKICRFLQILKNKLKLIQYCLLHLLPDRLESIQIFFSPCHAIISKIKKTKNIRRFMMVHDTIPILDFVSHETVDVEHWFSKIINGLDTETYYFCVSENTKKDFLKTAGQRIDEHKMFITPIATAWPLSPKRDKKALEAVLRKYAVMYNPGDEYIFSLCSIDPRKNLLFTISCFVKFIRKHHIHNLYFYLGGGHFDWFIRQFEEQLADFQDYKDKIVRLGYIDDGDVNILYSNSLFFTYLSQYEGFGMPPLEAMSAGTPVICSNNSSLPEVVGDAAITITYNDEESCIRAFEALYFNADLREAYIKKGLERAKLFSWEKTVDKMTAVMLDALRGGAYVNP